MADAVVEGYARAMYEIAVADNLVSEVEDEMFRFARTLESEHELRRALSDLALPQDRKVKLVDELLARKATPTTVSLVNFVVAQGKARFLTEIVDRFVEISAQSRERVVAEVRSAVPLPPEVEERLAAALSRRTGKQVEVKVVVDETVIGGIVATVGDVVIDGSVRHRLDAMRDQLI